MSELKALEVALQKTAPKGVDAVNACIDRFRQSSSDAIGNPIDDNGKMVIPVTCSTTKKTHKINLGIVDGFDLGW